MKTLLLCLLLATPAAARPIVLELFTSQGCSSCPPADALLTQYALTRPDLLPLAFHVTYWNSLGWRDPFSLQAATDRQQDYQDTLGHNEVYTPQLIVNGTTDLVGSDDAGADAAIAHASTVSAAALMVLPAEGGVEIRTGGGPGTATIWVVGFDASHRTSIGRGENGGRTLDESNIVRGIKAAGQWTGTPLRFVVVPPPGERVAVLLQDPAGHVIDAAVLR